MPKKSKVELDKVLFGAYAELENEKKAIEAKQAELKETLMAQMEANEVADVKTEWGTFSKKSRESWQYTDEVKKSVKTIELKAQEDGSAEKKTTFFLSFYAKKDGE